MAPCSLSGLLIGHEVRAAGPDGALVQLVGDLALIERYARAIGILGGEARIEGADAAARGLAIAARVPWD